MNHTSVQRAVGGIAIIGMSARVPGAADLAGFWRNLVGGIESVSFFDEAQLRAAGVAPELLALPGYVKARPVLEGIEWFDPAFFGYSPREAALIDPQQRLFLESAWEALEQAGCDSERFAGPIGVFGGTYLDTYLLANLCAGPGRLAELLAGVAPGAYHAYLGNDKDYLATRVAYKLNLRGPAMTVQTACSTSLVAVCQACQSLLCQQCDIALAGGATVIVPQLRGYLAQEGGMFSPDGHCRPFDAAAQGTTFGSGVGVVALKRLEDALADGDPIHAVIKGSALNNDGALKVSYTAPSVTGQAEVIALAQAVAGVSAESIQYIEAHGTGTPLGDPIEVEALTQAFRLTTDKTGYCGLGSVKGNLGHLDAAAGVVGLIKTVLALEHGLLPPTLHFRAPNPRIDFDHSPFHVIDTLTPWPATDGPRRAGVNSFGVGGTNAHVVLEQAPPDRCPERPARAQIDCDRAARAEQLLVVSAKTAPALEQACARLAAHLAEPGAAEALPDIAYTLETGRRAFVHRRVFVARTNNGAVLLDPKQTFSGQASRREPPVVFLFPGQGAQQPGMGAGLYDQEPVYRAAFDRCAALVPELDLRAAMTDKAQLLQTRVTQPALFAIEYALAQLWISWGVTPAAMIGHSVGEYVAGCLAGVMSLEDALRLVAARARLIQAQPPGAMTAVRLAESELVGLLGPELSIAAINAPGLCIVSGPREAVADLENRLKAEGKASVRLQTSHAFHSAMMDPVTGPYTELLRQVKLCPPRLPYVSNVTGRWISATEATDPQYWAGHVRQPVRFADGIAQFFNAPEQVLLEVGPGSTLAGLARQHPAKPRDQVVVHGGDSTRELLAARGRLWLAGLSLGSEAFFAGQPRRRVSLPTYPFQRQRCWIEPESAAATPAQPESAADTQSPATTGSTGPEPVLERLRRLFGQLSGRQFGPGDDHTSFIELGFESLFLTQASLALAREFGVRIAFRELLDQLNSIASLAARLRPNPHSAISNPQSPIPDLKSPVSNPQSPIRNPQSAISDLQSPISNLPPPPASAPLTEAQREVWLATQLGAAASCAFNQSCVLHLRGPLDRPRLRLALAGLEQRHDGLRLSFSPLGDLQRLRAGPGPELVLEEQAVGGADGPAALDGFLAQEAATAFDLEHGPVWRARLVTLGPAHAVLLLTVHHIVCDGRSLALLAHELGELYSGRALPPSRSMLAFARDQDTASAEYAAARQYWLARFAPVPVPLELPTDHARPVQQEFKGGLVRCRLPAVLGAQLRQAGARHGCTLFGTLLAAYAVLLHRLSGQSEIVVGVPTAAPGTETAGALVGHTVNFLGLRLSVRGESAWADHLAGVKQLVLEAFEHRQFTYGTLIQHLDLARDTSRLPLVSVSFNFAQARYPLRFDALEAAIEPNPHSFTNQDLFFDFNAAGDQLELDCVYNKAVYSPATIGRWLGHFQVLLAAIAGAGSEPVGPVGDLPVLSPAERHQLLVQWNDTSRSWPPGCLPELVAAQITRTPEAVAVRFGSEELSYRQLDAQADRVASWLQEHGVGPDKIVGINLERSLGMVVALLGITRAGGAYLPLDPVLPAERLEYMVADAEPVLVLTDELLRQALASPNRARPVTALTPECLAYVLYTSGSTGKPKGVAVPHRALVNCLRCFQETPGMRPGDVIIANTTLAFDIAEMELWLPLISGARIELVNRDTAADGAALARVLASTGATWMQGTPATWRMLLAAGWAGTPGLRMFCGGEDLPPDLANDLLARGAELWNLYGPTETTIYSTAWRVIGGQPIVIGRPVGNTTCYVLDGRFQPVPLGVTGELFIGGQGVARGYLHRPSLTAERFIPNPFDGGRSRLYRTGDLVRWQPDGHLKYLGRLDYQVKIRGFRIELGEIEATLRSVAPGAEAVVLAREDRPGDKRLVAYLRARRDHLPGQAQLRQRLGRVLPEYMVPAAFVPLEQFPLTPSGKIDRRALPAPEEDSRQTADYQPPRTPLECNLAEIWAEVLHRKPIGASDNFFAVGGHSLLATQVMARVRDSFGVEVPLRSFLAHPTLRGLAEHLEGLLWARRGQPAGAANPSGPGLVEGEL